MKKRIFGMLLMGAMVVASVSMFTSCKDYDDDINKLQKQIDEITAQNLQTQLNSLQSALSAAQSTADAAKAAAAEAEAKAKAAQETGDDAAKAATEAAATAAATAVAAAQDVSDLEAAIAGVQAILDGKVSKDELTAAIEEVEKKIVAINENLLTLDDVKKLLEDEGFASAAVVKDIESQIEALQAFQKKVEDLKLDASWKKKVDDAVASLTQIKKDIEANTKSIADIKKLAEQASKDASSVTDSINRLNVFVKRLLTSLTLSPSKFYGGIEGTDIFSFRPKKETMYARWAYFMNSGVMDLSEMGLVDYHVSPANVDLTKFDIKFFTRTSDIVEPAATEKTRAAADNGRITPVYGTTDLLMEQKDKSGKMLYWNAKTGILTVPFTAAATAIKNDLDKSIANMTAVQLTKKGKDIDTDGEFTVTSDYALVYPSFAYELLICDNSFEPKNPKTDNHVDNIGKDNGDVNSYHLHRNFSFLALATTSPTHEILYNGKFDITKVLETHYVDKDKLITDTVVLNPHAPTAPNGKDGDASVNYDAAAKSHHCFKIDDEKLAQLGLHYEINIVNYNLGTTQTSESAHIELVEEEGHIIAYPRNIKADGSTDKGKTANASAAGRMPIVCIELKKGDQTVSFAWMKFLITKGEEVKEVKKTAFDLKDHYYANCKSEEGSVTWNQVEYQVYNKLVGMSKETFDATYEFDKYTTAETEKTLADQTTIKVNERLAEQYKADDNDVEKAKKFTKLTADQRIGDVIEEWNASDQEKEDGTTHVLIWRLYQADFWNLYKTIKLDRTGSDIVNAEEVSTWVRYKRIKSTDGEPAIYIKFTIPKGQLHFAKGTLDGTKTLSYWYNIPKNAGDIHPNNAETASDAKEVRVSVPVPVPDGSTPAWTYKENNTLCPWNENLWIHNDNTLERTEFIKDLHDFFLDGKLNASVSNSKFNKIKDIEPEFSFTLPSTSLGNATFDAAKDGTWKVSGITGTEYTLKLWKAATEDAYYQIRISPYTINDVLCSISEDDKGVRSVIKYHEGAKQDDILNAYGHDNLGEKKTFTAYIQIVVKQSCAPVEFDDMWFNVRFLRPLDMQNPDQGLLPDAPNDWQEVDLAQYILVTDWRNYLIDMTNSTAGTNNKTKTVNGVTYKLVDKDYYGLLFNIDDRNFKTDAHYGAEKRDNKYTKGAMIDINDNKEYSKDLVKTSAIQGLILEKIGDTKIRYKNNSSVTGGFHVYVPIQMTYVFGSDKKLTQTKYVTLGVTSTVAQPQ